MARLMQRYKSVPPENLNYPFPDGNGEWVRFTDALNKIAELRRELYNDYKERLQKAQFDLEQKWPETLRDIKNKQYQKGFDDALASMEDQRQSIRTGAWNNGLKAGNESERARTLRIIQHLNECRMVPNEIAKELRNRIEGHGKCGHNPGYVNDNGDCWLCESMAPLEGLNKENKMPELEPWQKEVAEARARGYEQGKQEEGQRWLEIGRAEIEKTRESIITEVDMILAYKLHPLELQNVIDHLRGKKEFGPEFYLGSVTTMEKLIGHSCRIEFNLEHTKWPIPGFPAWANCEGVHGQMINLGGVWYNMSIIQSIGDAGPAR